MTDLSGECTNCGSTDVEVQSQAENAENASRKATVVCADCGSTIGRTMNTNYKSPVVDNDGE